MSKYYVCPKCKTYTGDCMIPTGKVFDKYSEYHLNEENQCQRCGWVGTFADMEKIEESE